MTHSDDDGMVMPPRVASAHVVLLPIFRKPEERQQVMDYTEKLAQELRRTYYHHERIGVEIDTRDIGGARGWDWVKKGIPLRVEIGPRDIAADQVFIGRRDQGNKGKFSLKREQFIAEIPKILDDIQNALFDRALRFRDENTCQISDSKEFYNFFTPQNKQKPEIHGGFSHSLWCGDEGCEGKIKDDLNVTIRCLPFDQDPQEGRCIGCGQPATQIAIFAKAY